MALGSTTAPLRHELESALPERPFELHFWDGSALPATATDNGRPPIFSARSPRAVAHALMAPGQLGLSRAYVSGELEVDDLDAVLNLLRDWAPPAIDPTTKRRLVLAAARAAGLQRPPRPPATELRPKGKRHSIADPTGHRAGGSSRATPARSATTTTSPTTSSRSSSTTR